MKKQLSILAVSGVFLGLMIGSAMAVDNDVMVYEPLPGTTVPKPPTGTPDPAIIDQMSQSNVSQAAIDYRNKRLDARERRTRALEVRAATIQAFDEADAADAAAGQ